MSQPQFNAYGAVDLGALAARSQAQQAAAARAASGPGAGVNGSANGSAAVVVDVTEASFQTDVVERSMTVPVVIDFWADWCGPCKQLSPILERLATADGGSWVLAKIDVDSNQRLAAAAGVQGIPAVKAVVGGRIIGEFTGALPEPQVRQWLDDLVALAAENGLDAAAGPNGNGEGPSGDPAVDAPASASGGPAADPGYVAALDAVERGDLDGAAAAYREVLATRPGDPGATMGLAQVELVRRSSGLDIAAVLGAAQRAPDDIAAQTQAADVEFLSGRVEEALTRLVTLVSRSSGDDREQARTHLLELFTVLGSEDPRVSVARRNLMAALF